MGDPDIFAVAVALVMTLLGVGGMVAIIRWSGWYFNPRRTGTLHAQSRLWSATQDERSRAIDAYKQIASEKLDVIKTAIAMGYNEQELKRLDARLEQLIGAEALRSLAMGEPPLAGRELEHTSLETELRAVREA